MTVSSRLAVDAYFLAAASEVPVRQAVDNDGGDGEFDLFCALIAPVPLWLLSASAPSSWPVEAVSARPTVVSRPKVAHAG